MTKRFTVAAVFLAGCAVGGVSGQLVVPKASAEQLPAGLHAWEYTCVSPGQTESTETMANRYGATGWEVATVRASATGGSDIYCFKRPKT